MSRPYYNYLFSQSYPQLFGQFLVIFNTSNIQLFFMKTILSFLFVVVNTASQCGYTPQYASLQKVYSQYKDKLVIIGFPCNQFGGQEPGTNAEIVEFCEKNYGVTFPLADKVDVKGTDQSSIYQWLTQKTKNGVLDATIGWNFNKFLLDENGKMLAYFPSNVKPDSDAILNYLK